MTGRASTAKLVWLALIALSLSYVINAIAGSKAPQGFPNEPVSSEATFQQRDDSTRDSAITALEPAGLLAVGDSLPHINMFDLYGNAFDSHKLLEEGNFIVVSFFTTYCEPCIEEFPGFKRIIDEAAESVVVLLVSVGQDDRNELKAFYRKHELSRFTVIRDKFGYVRKPFGIDDKVPVTMLSDPNGTIVHTQYGAFPDAKVWEVLQPLIKSEIK